MTYLTSKKYNENKLSNKKKGKKIALYELSAAQMLIIQIHPHPPRQCHPKKYLRMHKTLKTDSKQCRIHARPVCGAVILPQRYTRMEKKTWGQFYKTRQISARAQFKNSADGREISVCDLLTMHKLKNTEVTSHLHID